MSLSIEEIKEWFYTKYEKIPNKEIEVLRILKNQQVEEAFNSLRKGLLDISIGGSHASSVIGIGYGFKKNPQIFLDFLSKKFPHEKLSNMFIEKGNLCESMSCEVLRRFINIHPYFKDMKQNFGSKNLNIYDGCFYKINLHGNDNKLGWEFNNLSPDGIIPKIDIDDEFFSNQNYTNYSKDLVESKMLSINDIECGIEIKNPFYGPYETIKPEHMAQCQYYMLCLNTKYTLYVVTYFENPSENNDSSEKMNIYNKLNQKDISIEELKKIDHLSDLMILKIHRNEEFIGEMLKRMKEFSLVLHHNSNQKNLNNVKETKFLGKRTRVSNYSGQEKLNNKNIRINIDSNLKFTKKNDISSKCFDEMNYFEEQKTLTFKNFPDELLENVNVEIIFKGDPKEYIPLDGYNCFINQKEKMNLC